MRIRSSLLGVALVMVVAASASADRPKVAILGVEVVGDGIDVESIKVGNNLTNALRVRPNASQNPYQIAPNSNKELADEKVIKNCGSEDPSCMSAIGNDLGADVLIFGKLEKSTQNNVKGYSAHLVILNVGKKTVERTWKDFIPNSETGPDDIQKWAKSAYGKLAGGSSGGGGGGLTLKVENTEVDKGTVFIDGKVSDKLSNGKVTVTGVSDGKHHVVVEVGGYKKYEEDIIVTSSDTKPHVITLEADTNLKTCDPKVDPTCEVGGTVSQGGGNKGWKIAAIASTVVAVGAAIPAAIYSAKVLKTDGGNKCVGDMAASDECKNGDKYARNNYIFWSISGAAAVVAVYSWYRVAKGSKAVNSNEHSVRLTPVVAPSVAGASLSFDW